MEEKASLYGIYNSNRDFSTKDNWGKNQFNSSFPAALACYMDNKEISPVFLKLDPNLVVFKDYITVRKLFNIPEEISHDEIFFEFEGRYTPHDKLDESVLRSDLVIRSIDNPDKITNYYSHHEVKLTVVPDSSTFSKENEEDFGAEIVIRTVSIIHLSINLIEIYKNNVEELKQKLQSVTNKISNWNNQAELLPLIPEMMDTLNSILHDKIDFQSPLIINPIWKTQGKSSGLDDNCLDLFVWSDFALTRLFMDSISIKRTSIDRYSRALIWVLYLLHKYTIRGKINSSEIYSMPFNNQTDKAFAVNGNKTNKYMKSQELLNPRVKKEEIGNIILNGGQLMLSPERRFDAAIFFSADIFGGEEE